MRQRSGSATRLPIVPAPRLLLITGLPASGKTQLARLLAARYRGLSCSKDEIKEILFDTLGASDSRHPPAPNEAWSRRLSDASFALLFAFAQRLLQSDRLLLLEGNFRPGEHEPPLAALLSVSGARFVQVLCHACPASLAARIVARAADPDRHPGHCDSRHAAAAAAAGPRITADSAANVGPRVTADLPAASETTVSERFLALPGPRLRFDSDAARERELATLYAALDAWDSAAA